MKPVTNISAVESTESNINPSLADTVRKQEWCAWQAVCCEWDKGGATNKINDVRSRRMVAAIQLWGEQLVALRLEQTPEQRKKAMQTAKLKFSSPFCRVD